MRRTRRIRTLQFVEPERLEVMLRGQHAGVEEDHDDDEPVERLRLYDASARLAAMAIRQVQRPPETSTPLQLHHPINSIHNRGAVDCLFFAVNNRR